MKNAYIIDAIRTPFGRYAGGLAPVRADDLGALPIKALMERNPTACRFTLSGAGNDRKPPVWFIDGCHRNGSTCD